LRPLNDSSGEGPPLEAIFEDYSGETDGEVYLNEVRLAYFMSLQADAKKKKKEMVSIEVSLDASADEATDFDDSFCPGPFLAFKYFLVKGESAEYVSKIISERNVVVRYLFPVKVASKSRTEIKKEMKKKDSVVRIVNETITTTKKAYEDRAAKLLLNLQIEEKVLTNALNNKASTLKDAALFGLSEEEVKKIQVECREISQQLNELRQDYFREKKEITDAIAEFSSSSTTSSMLMASPTLTASSPSFSSPPPPKKAKNSISSKTFMPHKLTDHTFI